MKKSLLLFIFLISSTFSKEYMAQIKPNETFEIKAEVSGLVGFIQKDKEANFIKDKTTIVKLNTKDEKIDLQANKDLLISQNEIVKIKKMNYQAKGRIKQLSQYDKNNEKISYLEAKKELINTKKTISNLENTIDKKTFNVQNRYLGEIFAKQNQFLDVGEKVYESYDISKLKITLYLTKEEIDKLPSQALFINNEKSEFKVNKVYKIKDSVKISRYKVEFTKKNRNYDSYFFDKVVKVELK